MNSPAVRGWPRQPAECVWPCAHTTPGRTPRQAIRHHIHGGLEPCKARTNECLVTISAWVLAWGEGSKSFSSPVTSRNRSSNSALSGRK